MSQWFRQIPWLLVPLLALSVGLASAQTLTATLSGIAADPSNARIPGADIKVINQATNDLRVSKADGTGFFSVTALPPGTYTLEVSEKGFATFKETGIVLNQGDSRTVPNIHLQISSSVTAVTVISGENAEIPTDTAEISDTLNNELVDSATLTGRNAAELIKMMPGVAFNNAGNAGSAYNSQVTGTNNGPAGNFSANGTQPYGSTSVILDGANLIDPGNAGTQVANINQDMTDSVKYLSASYGAEYAKGPAILEAFSKSGGQKYHGEAYLYARNTAVGYANDWNAKYLAIAGGGQPVLQPQSFYYIGGNVGGPVSLLGFNRNRDKLFFWGGYEKMIQHPYSSPVLMNVPTADQLSGDYNNSGVPAGAISQYPYAYALPCATDDGWQGCNSTTSPWGGYGNGVPAGTTPVVPNLKSYFDPYGVIISNLNPAANVTPNAANGWNNFQYAPSLPVDRWEMTGKLTYAFNDTNKLWGSYAYQTETDDHPLSIWWAPEWTVPYPSQPIGKETANLYLANYTHVFNATTTNEFVFAYAKFVNDNSLSNTAASSRAKLGFPAESLFGTSNQTDQIPNFDGDWNVGITEINEFDFNSGIYGPNTFGKTSKAPSITDTFTKIVRSHSIKAGFYWDAQENLQSNGSNTNGDFNVSRWGATDTYNNVLDRLMGRNASYNETNLDPVPDLIWHEWSLWAQDSWKASTKLTVNVGLRADHEGQWYDKIGGTQVWDPSTYVNTADAPANTGLLWNKINSAVPTSGWKSQLFLYDPRVGIAYDVFGTGNTVVRGGFGTYRYQVSGNDASGAMSGPLGSYDFNTNSNGGPTGFYGYNIQSGAVCTAITGGMSESCAANSTKQLTIPQGLNQNGASGVKADAMGDNRVPYADTWSFGVAQALPSHTVAEVSYVGSMSRNQLLNGQNGHIQDANPVGYGVFFLPDPKTGLYENLAPCTNDPTTVATSPCPNGAPVGATYTAVPTADYQPLSNYGDIWIQTHGGYANYNSLQVSAQKQSGNLYVFTNFTFGKVLGTRDGSTSNGNGNGPVVNPFNLDSNYGPLEYDHTKVFNLSASYKLPKPIHNNRLLGEVVNGWQLTTYTTYEDGAPYQTTSPNMNMNYQQFKDPSGTTINTPITLPIPANSYAKSSNGGQVVVGNQTYNMQPTQWIGTSQPENGIQPVVICDPRQGLKKGQYFNPNCFAGPLPPTATTFGQEGQTIWPYIRTPHYFGSDLAVFKAFRITDSQRIEIRVSATNWLNHPNAQFGLNGTSDNQLLLNGLSSGSSLTTNTNASTTGIPNSKVGYRWMQFAAKYYF
ncbi:MAG TPA: carboxypeptidase regulatory-like domain-containing protein [Terracidiphilus sp.]|nr:carboxypeptidase regulatory-like domain-containing protein [Terracidiphilus sp.]